MIFVTYCWLTVSQMLIEWEWETGDPSPSIISPYTYTRMYIRNQSASGLTGERIIIDKY